MFCVLLGPIFLIPSSWVGVHVHKCKRHRNNSVSWSVPGAPRGPGYAPVARFGLKNVLCPLNSIGMISQDYFLNLLFLLPYYQERCTDVFRQHKQQNDLDVHLIVPPAHK